MLTFLSIVFRKTNSDIFLTLSLPMKIKAVYMTLSMNNLFTYQVGIDLSDGKIQRLFIKALIRLLISKFFRL